MRVSAAYRRNAPKMWRDCATKLATLYAAAPSLKPPFPKGVYSACTINFPPNTACRYHVDHANRAGGWCSVYAGGTYNPDEGGHLVLPQLKIFIRFPPGSTILLPSATLLHGNTFVPSSQSRWSFVQYCAGGLFRFVEYGLTTMRRMKREDPVKAIAFEQAAAERWHIELGLLSRIDSLHQDRVACGLVR